MINASVQNSNDINRVVAEMNPENDMMKGVWLMSIDNKYLETVAGVMVSARIGHHTMDSHGKIKAVGSCTGARCLVEQTHRLATKEEIATFLAEQEVARAAYKQAAFDEKQNLNVVIQAPAPTAPDAAMAKELADLKAMLAGLMADKASEPTKAKGK